MILSSAHESNRFARKYYQPRAGLRFGVCYPAINSEVADAVGEVPKERRVVLITRFINSGHKGSGSLREMLHPTMRDHTLVIITG